MGAIDVTFTATTTHLIFLSPILENSLLDELLSVLSCLADREAPSPLVIQSAHPQIFLAGAHLADIARLNYETCVGYARRGREITHCLDNHPMPTVAAVHGSCTGGGFDLVLSCDAVVASPSATFSHPGIKRGLVTGWSGTVRLPAAFGNPTARALLLEGRSLDAPTMQSLGSVHRICDDPATGATDMALHLAKLDPSRLRLWRELRRGRFVDSFRASMVENY